MKEKRLPIYSPTLTRKPDKIYETMIFRGWTTGRLGQWPREKESERAPQLTASDQFPMQQERTQIDPTRQSSAFWGPGSQSWWEQNPQRCQCTRTLRDLWGCPLQALLSAEVGIWGLCKAGNHQGWGFRGGGHRKDGEKEQAAQHQELNKATAPTTPGTG